MMRCNNSLKNRIIEWKIFLKKKKLKLRIYSLWSWGWKSTCSANFRHVDRFVCNYKLCTLLILSEIHKPLTGHFRVHFDERTMCSLALDFLLWTFWMDFDWFCWDWDVNKFTLNQLIQRFEEFCIGNYFFFIEKLDFYRLYIFLI